MICGGFVVGVDGWDVDLDALGFNDSTNLVRGVSAESADGRGPTRILKLARSSGLMVSALAMTGIRLTLDPSRFITSTSSGLTLSERVSWVAAPAADRCSRVSARPQKVETSVDPEILLVFAVRLLLLSHEVFMLVIAKFHNGSPAEVYELSRSDERSFLTCPCCSHNLQSPECR